MFRFLTVEAAVERGALERDRHCPGWENKITRPLRLRHCLHCILGQTEGDGTPGLLFGGLRQMWYGFWPSAGKERLYVALWNEQIALRRARQVAPVEKEAVTA
jgi:hypothetical protein